MVRIDISGTLFWFNNICFAITLELIKWITADIPIKGDRNELSRSDFYLIFLIIEIIKGQNAASALEYNAQTILI